MKLTLKQTKALDFLEDNVTKELEFGGGAGGGKSALGCYWQIKRRLKYPETRGLIGRSSLKTLKETTLNSFFQVCAMQGLRAGKEYNYNQQSSIIRFFNGSEILLKDLFFYPADPNFDELGSLEITDAFIDENNQIVEKAWNIVKSRIRYKLDDYGLIPKMMGSCNPSKNWVYTRFYKPHRDGILSPDKQFIQSLSTDNPFISPHYRDNLLGLDNNSKERLLYGNWEYDNDPAALINFDKITDLFTNTFVMPGNKYISADIARLGADKGVIFVWDGFKLIDYMVIAKSKITEAANFINQLRIKHSVPLSNVIADEDGVGGGAIDILGCEGFMNGSRALNNENYSNLKTQCYYKLAEKVNSNEIDLSILANNVEVKDFIIQEMEQVKQHNMDKDGKKSILPKEKVKEMIGRSPDYSDTLMMRMYFEVNKYEFYVN